MSINKIRKNIDTIDQEIVKLLNKRAKEILLVGHFKNKFKKSIYAPAREQEIFKKIGLFNENLIRSQDIEFNLRLKKAGGKIILAPNIISYYYPKDNLGDFFIHNFYSANDSR